MQLEPIPVLLPACQSLLPSASTSQTQQSTAAGQTAAQQPDPLPLLLPLQAPCRLLLPLPPLLLQQLPGLTGQL
jgi:hypothetical protein